MQIAIFSTKLACLSGCTTQHELARSRLPYRGAKFELLIESQDCLVANEVME